MGTPWVLHGYSMGTPWAVLWQTARACIARNLGHGGPGSIALDLASRRSSSALGSRTPVPAARAAQPRAAGLRAHRAPLALRHQTETRRAPFYERRIAGTANDNEHTTHKADHSPHDTDT